MRQIRKRVLDLAVIAQEGHIPSALSILDIVYVLFKNGYGPSLSTDDERPSSSANLFILSKGHGSLALYTVAEYFGLIDTQELDSFCQYESRFGGHPDRNKVDVALASTGSLGHGLPIAVGVALSRKLSQKAGKIFCLVGDGELNEGSNWESLLFASTHGLGNLVVLVDSNGSGERALPLIKKLPGIITSFGVQVFYSDGHDHDAILNSLHLADASKQPSAVIFETTKGYGIPIMENNQAWHHGAPSGQILEEIYEVLK